MEEKTEKVKGEALQIIKALEILPNSWFSISITLSGLSSGLKEKGIDVEIASRTGQFLCLSFFSNSKLCGSFFSKPFSDLCPSLFNKKDFTTSKEKTETTATIHVYEIVGDSREVVSDHRKRPTWICA
ncbi:hypothetical protein V8G54_034164 [Vigna mungo]|uniref:Uncharacterized protein n=1 Tax=Vigna mungo TaxID=3915 RepID=A0AAQ3MQ97_VIGMU